MGTESVRTGVHGHLERTWVGVGISLSSLVAVDIRVDVASFPLSIYLPEQLSPDQPFPIHILLTVAAPTFHTLVSPRPTREAYTPSHTRPYTREPVCLSPARLASSWVSVYHGHAALVIVVVVHLTVWVLKSDGATTASERSGSGVPVYICFLRIVTILSSLSHPTHSPTTISSLATLRSPSHLLVMKKSGSNRDTKGKNKASSPSTSTTSSASTPETPLSYSPQEDAEEEPQPDTMYSYEQVMSFDDQGGSSQYHAAASAPVKKKKSIKSDSSVELKGPMEVDGSVKSMAGVTFNGDFAVRERIEAYGNIDVNGNLTCR